jgi:hypothetical protein
LIFTANEKEQEGCEDDEAEPGSSLRTHGA